jgi:O-antigen/teichoic acid export membrane protein
LLQEQFKRVKNSLLLRNAGWLFAGQGLSFVVQAVSFVVLARLLQSSEYGVLSGAVALVTIVSQYGSLGCGQLYMRYVSADRSKSSVYWGNALLSVFLIGGLLVASLWLVGPWMIRRASLYVLVLLAMSECIFVQVTVAASMVFQTFEKMRVSATLTLLTSVLRLIFLLVMLVVLGHAHAWQWAMASLVISMLVAVAAVGAVTRSYGMPSFAPRLLFKRSGEGFVFAVSGSTTSVYNDLDKVILSHYGMLQANGIYSMAYRVLNIGTMPIMSLVGAAFPRFFQAGVNGAAAVLPMARTLLKRVLVPGVIAVVGMFVVAPILPRLVGNSYQEAASALRWLCLIPIFRCFSLSAGDALSGAGDQKFRLACQAAAAIGNGLLNLYLIPRYSWHGAAWASLLTDGALGIMTWVALLYLARRPKSSSRDNVLGIENEIELPLAERERTANL